jgi:hypothetical protein
MDQQDEEQQRAEDHLNRLYAAIFADDKRGVAILEDLERRFVRAPQKKFSQDAMLQTFVEAHVREVVEYILRRANAGQGFTPPQGPQDE